MRKKFLLILGLLSILALTACGSGKDSKNEKKSEFTKVEETKEMTTEVPEAEFKIGETGTNDKVEITVLDTSSTEQYTNEKASGIYSIDVQTEGNVYYVVRVKIKNVGNEPINIRATSFNLLNGEKKYIPTTAFGLDEALNRETINTDGEIERDVLFEVSKETADSQDNILDIKENNISKVGNMQIILQK